MSGTDPEMVRVLYIYFLTFLLGILFLVMISACNYSSESSKDSQSAPPLNDSIPPISFSSTQDLLEYCYMKRNHVGFDKACQALFDSLLIKGEYPYYFLGATNIVPQLNSVNWNLVYEKGIPAYDSKLLFEIKIRHNGLMIIEDQHIESDSKEFGQAIEAYLADSSALYELRSREINYFGKVKPLDKGFRISFIMEGDSLDLSSCETLMLVIYEIRSIYHDKRNKISLSKWNKGFESLSIDEKVAVMEVANLRMMVVFDQPR
jgi:hypothetical protein